MIDPDTFRAVLGRFATGITVVTARDEQGRDHGMTISAFSSVSLDPPLVLVCVAHDARMHRLLLDTDAIGISFLSADQEPLSRRFADRDCERFDGIGYTRGENGAVLLEEALAHMECTIVARHDAGDHTIHVVRVDRAEPFTGRPLLYYRGGYAQLER